LTNQEERQVRSVLQSDEDLKIYFDGMHKFDRHFCDCMVEGDDFTLTLEIRGNKGKMVHCRTTTNCFQRPVNIQEED